jgi:DNA-binding MarR family transcriptional regulator
LHESSPVPAPDFAAGDLAADDLPADEDTADPGPAAVRDQPAVRDQADIIVDNWRLEDPNLDVVVKSAAIRLRRAGHHLERALRREMTAFDVEMWEFDVLLTLRRVPGHQLSAGALTRACQVTSGAISNRLARLEERGWITRDIDPRDRRHVLVTLTPEGLERATQLIATKTVAEQHLFARLDRATLERMSDDLRALLISLEGPANDEPLTPEQWAQLGCLPEGE